MNVGNLYDNQKKKLNINRFQLLMLCIPEIVVKRCQGSKIHHMFILETKYWFLLNYYFKYQWMRLSLWLIFKPIWLRLIFNFNEIFLKIMINTICFQYEFVHLISKICITFVFPQWKLVYHYFLFHRVNVLNHIVLLKSNYFPHFDLLKCCHFPVSLTFGDYSKVELLLIPKL